MYIYEKNPDRSIHQSELELLVERTIEGSGALTSKRILIIPPDITRFHSRAGQITDLLVAKLGSRVAGIMPAIGTHAPMTGEEIAHMYPGSSASLFRIHDWRRDVAELGRIPEARVSEISGGRVRYSYPVQANRLLSSGEIDFIFSVGQVVPHEVAGMANHAKNIFVGTGGKEAIDRSHYLGAVCGMEGIMGRADTPVRALFDEALGVAAGKIPPIAWILTVIGSAEDGSLAPRGYFASLDRRCFEEAAALSAQVNIQLLEKPVRKAVVWLDPEEYRSTWLGNKSVYRMRMAMAEGGELLIFAPGLRSFGEDPNIDAVIRRYGYRPGAEIQSLVAREPALAENLSAAAHLIHGSSEGRFRISYAPGPSISREEIESVGYRWTDLDHALKRYAPHGRLAGFHTTADGEEFFFVPNPALGLWSTATRMQGA
ncbi:MAG: lactate racemase domain-containing protein [Rectinema sp.]